MKIHGLTHTTTMVATDIDTNESGMHYCKYHSTKVVQWNKEKIILNTGGWFSATTKRRMNKISGLFDLGYVVYQLHSTWYVDYDNQTYVLGDEPLTLLRIKPSLEINIKE